MEEKRKHRIRFQVLFRLLSRAAQIAASPEMTDEGRCVYTALLAPAADAFCKSHEAVSFAESALAEKRSQSQRMVSIYDGIYCTTRAIVIAFVPTQKLPETLTAQRTDTDVLCAIATLTSVVKSHAGQQWADVLMAGQFGTLTPKVDAAVNAVITASDALETARNERLAAYGPAYSAHLAFKRVVLNLMGSSSRAYRRLHLRKTGSEEIEADEPAEEAAPDSTVTPAIEPTPAATGEPSPVKVA